jgi:catechol 2,3-dioxygenase-like lactoylglutathione lyase family enzyme
MALKRLDHVNVRTANLEAMIAWYATVLGLEPGPRPPFPFGGAWLYCDGFPIVHLVEVREAPPDAPALKLEHFAIRAENEAEFQAHLQAKGVPYQKADVPGFGIRQFNIWDPDGNHIHIDFARDDAPG